MFAAPRSRRSSDASRRNLTVGVCFLLATVSILPHPFSRGHASVAVMYLVLKSERKHNL